MRKFGVFLVAALMFSGVAAAQTVAPESEIDFSLGFSDTIQERVNVSEYDTSYYENMTVKDKNYTGWHYEQGDSTYIFDFDNVDVSYTDNGFIEVDAVLKPNRVTKILHKESKPALTTEEAVRKFNQEFFYKGENITEEGIRELRQEAQDLSVEVLQGRRESSSLEKNIISSSGRQTLVVDPDENGNSMIKFGSNSGVVDVNGGSNDTYSRYKSVNVTDVNDAGSTIFKAQPVILSCGDDSTTGQGDIVIDCGQVDGVEDIDFANTTGYRYDYEIESFNLDTGSEAVAWVYRDDGWVRNGETQMRVYYGSGSVDGQDAIGTWNNTGQNAVMVQHLQDNPLTATDSTANNNDGTVTGAVATDGQFDGAGSFDGTDDFIEISSSTGLITDNPQYSIVMWTRVNASDSELTGGGAMYGEGLRGTFYNSASNNGGTTSGEAGTFIQDDSGTTAEFASNTQINDGNFHQVAWNIDNANDVREIFVDSALETTDTTSLGTISSGPSTKIGDSADFGQYGFGTTDALRVYSDTKSDNWIQADYDASPKGGQVFFSQNAGQQVTTNNPPVFNSYSTTPSDWSLNEAVDFSYDVSDDSGVANVTLEVFRDGTLQKEETFSYSGNVTDTQTGWYTPDSEGNYTVYFTATDDEGASSVETLEKEALDTTPPSVTIHEPVQNQVYDPSTPLSVSANETVDTWKYSLDGASNVTFTPNITVNGIANGSHTITVYANDSSGNIGSSSVDFFVDDTKPSISFNPSTTNSGTYSQNWIFLNVTATDDVKVETVTEEFDGVNSTFANNATPYFYENHTGLADGSYVFKAYATDDVGNTDVTETRTVTLDTTPPTSSDNYTLSGYQQQDVTVEFTSSDSGTGVDTQTICINNSCTTYSGTTHLETFTNTGTFNIDYFATDNVGNVEANNSETVQIDKEPPTVTIYEPLNGSNVNRNNGISFKFEPNDLDGTVGTCEVFLDNNTPQSVSCTAGSNSTGTLSLNNDGTHTFTVNVTDTDGRFTSKTTTFEAESANEIRFKNSGINPAFDQTIQENVQVRFKDKDGKKTYIVPYNNGKAVFNTSELLDNLPTGTTELRLKHPTVETFTTDITLDNTYTVNTSYSSDDAEVAVNVFNVKNLKRIPANLTFRNSTDFFELNEEVSGSVSGGRPFLSLSYEQLAVKDFTNPQLLSQIQFSVSTTNMESDEQIRVRFKITDGKGNLRQKEYFIAGNSTTLEIAEGTGLESVSKLEITGIVVQDGAWTQNSDISWQLNKDNRELLFEYDTLQDQGIPHQDATIRASSNTFQTRQQVLDYQGFEDINKSFYLLKTVDGQQYPGIKVINITDQPIEAATLTLRRDVKGQTVVVEQKKTTSSGSASFFLQPGEVYEVTAEKTGYITATDTYSPSANQFSQKEIVLRRVGDKLTPGYFEYQDKLSSNCDYNLTAVQCSYTSTTTDLDTVNLSVEQDQPVGTKFINSSTSTNANDTLTVTGLNASENTYRYTLTGNFTTGVSLVFDQGEFGERTKPYGDTGILLALFMVLTLSFAGAWKPSASIGLAAFAIIVAAGLNFLPLGTTALSAVIGLAAAMLWRMRT